MKKLPLFLLGICLFYCFSTKAQTSYDIAVTGIQGVSNPICIESNETVIVSVQHLGTGVIDLNVHPLIVYLKVIGTNGTQQYVDTFNSGLMSNVTLNVIFSNINFSGIGCYSLNTDSLQLLNSNYVTDMNDSLGSAITVCRSSFEVGNVQVTNVSCNGSNDGSIVVTGSGGAPPYAYNIQPISANNASGIFSNIPSGVYTVSVSDSNNCIRDTVVTILEPAVLTLDTVSTTNVLCKGGFTGSVVLTSSGGSGIITYSLSPPAGVTLNSVFNYLSAHSYIAIATDVNNCTATTSFTITEPTTGIQITNVTSSAPSCVPGCDATITVTASGGAGSLQYSTGLSFQPFGVFSNQCAGTYPATVTDANGCTASSNHIVSNSGAPVINTANVTNVSCNGGSDGSIQVSATPGTHPLLSTSIIAPIAISSPSGNFTNLAAGAYTVLVTDGNGCSIQTTLVVSEPLLYKIDSTRISSSCNPNGDSVILYQSGGTPPYSFSNPSWIQHYNTTNTSVLLGIPPGIQQFTVVDANGCSANTSLSIGSNRSLNISLLNITQPSSCTSNDGGITFGAHGTNNTINYSLQTAGSPTQYNITGTFGGLSPGTYHLSAVSGSCYVDTTVNISPSSFLTLGSVSATTVLCNGDSNGTIVATANGTTTFSISPNLGSQISPGSFVNLPSNTYTITATDAGGCSVYTYVTIAEPVLLTLVLDSVNTPTCIDSFGGAVFVTATGGNTGKYFSWKRNGNHVLHSLGGSLISQPAGNYFVTVTDANQCTATTVATILEPNALSISLNLQQPLCSPTQSGVIYITGNGGTPPFDYYHNGVLQGLYPPFLSGGKHEAKVIDANGCVAVDSVELLTPFLVIDSIVIFPKICRLDNNGGFQVRYSSEGSGFIETKVYDDMQQLASSTDLDSGHYKVVVFNNKTNCTDSANVYIPFIPRDFDLDIYDVTDASCAEVNDGAINYHINHSPHFIYEITPKKGTQLDNRNFTNLPAGEYVIRGENVYGCAGTDTIRIGAIDNRSMEINNIQHSNVHCYGSIQTEAQGGIGSYQYSISPNYAQQINSGNFEGLCWGDYTITATDSAGCSISKKITILEDRNAPTNMFDHVTVYPNPADNIVYFKSNYLFDYKVSLIDISGRCLKTVDIYSKNGSLNINNVAPGVYVLRFKSQVDHADYKLIISR